MSQSRRATISVIPQERPFPFSAPSTTRGQEPDGVQQLKERRRRMTICGDSEYPRLHSSPQVDSESIKTKPIPSPEQCPASPAWSYISISSSTSGKSVRFSDLEDQISPGQYSSHTPKSSPKSALKGRGVKTESMRSLFDEDTPVEAANAAIDSIFHDLVTCVKSFKCPSELDFSATTEEKPLLLINNDKNKSFINQLRNLNDLQTKLAEIPTHGDEQLREKYRAASVAIEQALQITPEHQFKLYKKVVPGSDTTFDDLFTALDDYAQSFKSPPELDFPANTEQCGLLLRNTEKIKSLIDQLRRLGRLRTWLAAIPAYGNQEFEDNYQAASTAIEQVIQLMQQHQRKLREVLIKATLLDNLLISVNNCVSKFEYPSELDFPTNTDNGELVLLGARKNEVFVGQFRALHRFRDQLISLGTHGNEQLEKKHKQIATTIAVSLQKLKKHQRKLQEQVNVVQAYAIKTVPKLLSFLAHQIIRTIQHIQAVRLTRHTTCQCSILLPTTT
ncbi:hypothetical protein RSAG8_12272, partial [Rhizoctonia solani AG-8 WAC10335]